VWAAPLAAFLPLKLVLSSRAAEGLSRLPAADVPLPAGEMALILRHAFAGSAGELVPTVLTGLAVVWAWTLLWHGGVVAWSVWSGGGPPRLAEVLGLGVAWWWRMLRLSLAALVVLLAGLTAICVMLLMLAPSSWDELVDGGLVPLAVVGLALSAVLGLVVWSATLRGAWLLARPTARSSVLAWLAGAGGALRHPLASFGTLLLWLVPGIAFGLLPLAAGWLSPTLRGGLPGAAVLTGAGLVRAFCWVALFCSFAPVSGLVGVTSEAEEADEGTPSASSATPVEPDPSAADVRRRIVAELPGADRG
jgi:hypothetical protein